MLRFCLLVLDTLVCEKHLILESLFLPIRLALSLVSYLDSIPVESLTGVLVHPSVHQLWLIAQELHLVLHTHSFHLHLSLVPWALQTIDQLKRFTCFRLLN